MNDEHLLLLKSYEQTLEASLQLVRQQITRHEVHLTKKSEGSSCILKAYPEVLKADEVSEILRVSKRVAYEIMERKDFPLIRINSNKRVLKEEFYTWLLEQQS